MTRKQVLVKGCDQEHVVRASYVEDQRSTFYYDLTEI